MKKEKIVKYFICTCHNGPKFYSFFKEVYTLNKKTYEYYNYNIRTNKWEKPVAIKNESELTKKDIIITDLEVFNIIANNKSLEETLKERELK